jgi:hypothetical protein
MRLMGRRALGELLWAQDSHEILLLGRNYCMDILRSRAEQHHTCTADFPPLLRIALMTSTVMTENSLGDRNANVQI